MNTIASGALPLDDNEIGRFNTAVAASQLTVLYGSQTGNGEAVAEDLGRRAAEQGYAVTSQSLADFKPARLKREALVTFVVSTHGEGDPPDDAELFHEFLMSDQAPALTGLRYSVLALGDSSYVNFCRTGREFDARLAALGAERFEPLIECDLDYEDMAAGWSTRILARLPEVAGAAGAAPRLHAVETACVYDRKNPYLAPVLLNQKITGRHSTKDVRHIELSLEDSGLPYEPGDSLAVIVENPPQLVDEIIAALSFQPEASVTVQGEAMTLREALSSRLEVTAPNLGFLRAWSTLGRSNELGALLDDGGQHALSTFLERHQIIDIVRRYPAAVSAQEFTDSLRKLSPRSYSIASSPNANPGEVHLTVAAVRYEAFGTPHWGAASTHLADRLGAGDRVAVYPEPNKRFRLPEADQPIVMIGPGTGIAPFRAFIEERIEQGAPGRNWLFFGDRNRDSDFLYQLEWQRYLKQGHLHRIDVAFSRDQRRKCYVQHRLAERAADLYRWIRDGAVIYVCGDAKKMASDVHEALLDVLQSQARLTRDAAAERLRELRRDGRYQRDVY